MLSFFCAYKMSSASWLSYSTSLCPFTLTLTGILHHAPTAKYCSEGEHEHFFQCLYCWLWTSKCLLWSFLNKTLILCLVCLKYSLFHNSVLEFEILKSSSLTVRIRQLVSKTFCVICDNFNKIDLKGQMQ